MSPESESLAIDLLVTADQRRPLTVAGHHAFRESLSSSRQFDEIDGFLEEQQDAQDAMSDPLRDHLPQQATNRKTKGVLSILDQLDAEQANSNRRFNR